METKRRGSAAAEAAVPGLIGVILILVVPTQIHVVQSLTEASSEPRWFAYLIAAGLILTTIVRLILIALKRDKEERPDLAPLLKPRLWIGLGLIVLYAILIPILGFILSTLIVMVGISRVLGRINWLYSILIASGTSLIIWGSFVKFLHVPLAKGLLDGGWFS
jgi:hypothetical protein